MRTFMNSQIKYAYVKTYTHFNYITFRMLH